MKVTKWQNNNFKCKVTNEVGISISPIEINATKLSNNPLLPILKQILYLGLE